MERARPPIRTCAEQRCGKAAAKRMQRGTPSDHAHARRAIRSRRVHDGADVVHALLQRRRYGDRVGHAGAPLVEDDQPPEACDALAERDDGWVVPHDLEVADEPRDHEDGDRPEPTVAYAMWSSPLRAQRTSGRVAVMSYPLDVGPRRRCAPRGHRRVRNVPADPIEAHHAGTIEHATTTAGWAINRRPSALRVVQLSASRESG